MNTNIKPCPFCGKRCDFFEGGESSTAYESDYWIECDECEYRGKVEPTKKRAIEAHNQLAELRAKAINWKGWPEEKPIEGVEYLVELVYGTFDTDTCHTETCLGGEYWKCNGENVVRFAEIPRPEGEV